MRSTTVALLFPIVVACGAATPVARDVEVATTGCGDAFAGGGHGIDIGDGIVVTAAHVVAQADVVTVDGRAGRVIAWDDRADLALIEVDTDLPRVRYGEGGPGTTGTILGRPGEVVRRADVRIERILGTDRVVRDGYEIDADVGVGDSGAGFFDDDGSLVGVLFAVGSAGDGVWLVSSGEVEALVGGPRTVHRCDPARSRLVP